MAKRALITGVTGPGRVVPGRIPALEQGYEVDRHGPALEHRQLRADRPHSGPARPWSPGDLLDEVSLINILRDHRPTEVYNLAAQSFVQTSCSQPVLTGETTALGVTRLLDAIRLVDPDDPLLPGQLVGDVRQGAGGPPARVDPLLPAQPLRRGQGLRPLDHRQLPGELRPPRLVGDPLQPRVAPPGTRVRHPQDHPRRGPHRQRARRQAGPRQPRRPAGLGLCRRLRAGHVADAPAGRPGRLRGGRPARPTRCASSASWPSRPPASTGSSTW